MSDSGRSAAAAEIVEARPPEPTTGVAAGVAMVEPPRGYERRKIDGWCTYGVCSRRAADGYQLCSQHRAQVNARKRKRTARVRSELAAKGKCIRCRKPSATYRCPGCRVLDGTNLPTMGVATGVAADGDQWRRDNDGWKRFRGKGRRGAPGAAANDEQDLSAAFDELARGRAALIYARSARVAELGRIQRKDALEAAAAILDLATKFIADVVDRARGVKRAVP